MDGTESRRTWPRVTLTLPPEAGERLAALAPDHLRDRRREALRLLLDGIERESRAVPEPVRR